MLDKFEVKIWIKGHGRASSEVMRSIFSPNDRVSLRLNNSSKFVKKFG